MKPSSPTVNLPPPRLRHLQAFCQFSRHSAFEYHLISTDSSITTVSRFFSDRSSGAVSVTSTTNSANGGEITEDPTPPTPPSSSGRQTPQRRRHFLQRLRVNTHGLRKKSVSPGPLSERGPSDVLAFSESISLPVSNSASRSTSQKRPSTSHGASVSIVPDVAPRDHEVEELTRTMPEALMLDKAQPSSRSVALPVKRNRSEDGRVGGPGPRTIPATRTSDTFGKGNGNTTTGVLPKDIQGPRSDSPVAARIPSYLNKSRTGKLSVTYLSSKSSSRLFAFLVYG